MSSAMTSAYSFQPSFSEAEIKLERCRIELIDQILADRGALMLNDLFLFVQRVGGDLFPTLTMLKGFIQSRTNVFQADQALSTEIRNRSIEYRKAMCYIVDRLADTSKQRKINYISAELGSHFPTVKLFEVGSGDAAAFKFVSEHKSILAFAGPTPPKADQRLICLHRLAQTIPSVWLQEILPEYDQSIYHYDRSITISATGRVVNAVRGTNYLKLEIVDGSPYREETVYVIGKNVGFDNVDLTSRFPRTSLVRFTAFRAYFAAQPWTATSIEEASKEESADLEERRPTVVPQKPLSSAVDNNQLNKTAAKSWSGSNAATQAAANATPTLTEKDERKTIELIDSVVGGERMLIHSLWTRLQQKCGSALVVKDEAELEEFLNGRPHLFFVDQDSVTLRSSTHRIVVSRLIEDMKSGTKFTMDSLGSRIGSYSAVFKRDVYGSGNAWAHKFLDDHRTLLEVVGPFSPSKPLGQSVQLRCASVAVGTVRQVSPTPLSPTLSASSIAVSDPTPPPIHGCGVIKKFNKMYGYLMIEGGQHAGSTVYFTASELKQDCGSIDELTVGDYLNFEATSCANKGMAHPWRATRLSLAVGRNTLPSKSSDGECSASPPNASQKQQSTVIKGSTEVSIETISKKRLSTSAQRPPHDAIVQLETSRKAMVDNYLEYDPLTVDALFERFALAKHELFSYHYQMVEFLCIRSHLYAVDFVKKSVSRRPKDYRRVVSKLLTRCCQGEDCLVEDLRQLALRYKDNKDITFSPIDELCQSKLEFENFLKEHEQIFEMTEVIDDKENRLVQARGTYDIVNDVFLPRYYY